MEISRNLNMALESLLHNKTRSILTMIGIVLGISIAIIFVSMGQSAKLFITNEIQSMGMGANTLVVHPGKMDPPLEPSKLSYEDAEQVKKRVSGIIDVMPAVFGSRKAKFGSRDHQTMIYGVTANYSRLINHKVAAGRFFDEAAVNARKKVCVVGKILAEKLFGAFSPIGEKLRVGSTNFICLGIMEEKGEMFGYSLDDVLIIPITTAQSLLHTRKLVEIVVWTQDESQLEPVKKQIKSLLLKRHMDEDDFHFHTQGEMLSILGTIINALTGFIAAMAGLSLLVGGIGITNIMLGTLARRTREIGIRKAIGAQDFDIRRQFLFESGVIGAIGGIIGVGGGIGITYIVLKLIGLPFWVPWWIVVSALVFCAGVGLAAGIYPALRAARLSPMEALRYE